MIQHSLPSAQERFSPDTSPDLSRLRQAVFWYLSGSCRGSFPSVCHGGAESISQLISWRSEPSQLLKKGVVRERERFLCDATVCLSVCCLKNAVNAEMCTGPLDWYCVFS